MKKIYRKPSLSGKLKNKKTKNHNIGLPPGSLVYTGTEGLAPVFVYKISFKGQELQVDEAKEFQRPNENEFFWWDVNGTHNPTLIKMATDFHHIHRLNGEDMLNPFHRPKFEDRDHYLFVITKRVKIDPGTDNPISFQQVNLVLTHDSLLSVHEVSKSFFETFRKNLSPSELKNIKPQDGSYLLYRILDMIVDEYFLAIDSIREYIAEIEEEMHKKDPLLSFEQINFLRSDIQKIIRAVTPLKEVVYGLRRSQSELLTDEFKVYMEDVKDNLNQISDNLLQITDRLNNSFEVLLSLNNFKTNEIMKTLTLITTIFMPMTFIASLYGMNIRSLPLAQHEFGFLILMGLMTLFALLMGLYFWRKRWL